MHTAPAFIIPILVMRGLATIVPTNPHAAHIPLKKKYHQCLNIHIYIVILQILLINKFSVYH